MRRLRQIELGWPVFDAAQRPMLDGVEADHAQGEGVPDGAADVGEPKGMCCSFGWRRAGSLKTS